MFALNRGDLSPMKSATVVMGNAALGFKARNSRSGGRLMFLYLGEHRDSNKPFDAEYALRDIGWVPECETENKRSGDWKTIEQMRIDGYEGWCWIVHKGRVTEAYRDHEYRYRFGRHSQNVYMTECITYVMPWPYPEAPAQQGGDA